MLYMQTLAETRARVLNFQAARTGNSDVTHMKRQIADFLGELAEEMGWAPQAPEPRITPPRLPASPSTTPRAPRQDDTLRSEVTRLRGTVEHLSSEITNLRAEMARLRNLPAPPDAFEAAVPEVASAPRE